jgi:ubiquinone/menaquinone biosynthesis C-methylase UbiE
MSATGWADYYNRKADTVDELRATYESPVPYRRVFYRERFERTLELLAPSGGERILEIGCGPGYHSRAIAAAGAELTAVDLAERYVEQAARYAAGAGRFVVADAERLPFEDASFEKVLLAEVLEHLPAPELALRECHRVLVDGGTLVVTTPSRYSPMNVAYGLKRRVRRYAVNEHLHEWTPASLSRLLGGRFDVDRLEFANYLLPYPLDLLYVRLGSPGASLLPRIDRALAQTPVVRRLGWTMLVSATRRP